MRVSLAIHDDTGFSFQQDECLVCLAVKYPVNNN